MNSLGEYVRQLAELYDKGKTVPLGQAAVPERAPIASDAPVALVFSPHPDDEVIIGGAALRLMKESGWRVINVAVTQGSNPDRQQGRLAELTRCCEHVGFELVQTAPNGLEGINPGKRTDDPDGWAGKVERIAEILKEHQPKVIFFPHDDDWNSTHIGTHLLLVDALKVLGEGFSCEVLETEFWGSMDDPNVMVESSVDDLGELITALTFHVKEVDRNPYHLRLPGWMIDNVRRGGELVGVQGGAAPDFLFATLYRYRRWAEGGFRDVLSQGKFVGAGERVADLFGEID